MRYAVPLGDIAEQLFEITDQLFEDIWRYTIFDFGYSDDAKLAEVRLRKLTAVATTIYLTVNAVRVTEEMDDTTETIICQQIEHVLNDVFVRTVDGTPYYVFPICDYLDDHGLNANDLAREIYLTIHDAFMSHEAFEASAYLEIVNWIMDIPEDIDLYDFTLSEQFRYRLGVNPDGRIRGIMIIAG